MAVTISTSQDWDSAARAAGEATTIQSGAVLTVNTDTRYHKNAPAAGTGTFGCGSGRCGGDDRASYYQITFV